MYVRHILKQVLTVVIICHATSCQSDKKSDKEVVDDQDKTKETGIIGREKKAVKTQKKIASLENKINNNQKLYIKLEKSISVLESAKNTLSKDHEKKYAELNDLKSVQRTKVFLKRHFP